MLTYKGFDIDSSNQIFRNGIRQFTARWFTFENIEGAKSLIDQSLATKEKQNRRIRYKQREDIEVENGFAEAERFSEWASNQAEMQMGESV